MFERLSERAWQTVGLAQDEARLLHHDHVGTEHILLGLIREGESPAAAVLDSLGIVLEGARLQVEEIIGQGQETPRGHIPFTPRAEKLLEVSLPESSQLNHIRIDTEQILLRLIGEGEGVAAKVLVRLGVDLDRAREQVLKLLTTRDGEDAAETGVRGEGIPSSSLVLDQFGRNLTASAREGKLSPVIGRAKEIERVLQVLSQRTTNNPVLIGEPGVDTIAVVEGLAQMVVKGEVPKTLKDMQLYMLDLGSLAADTPELGDVVSRLKSVLDEGRSRGGIIMVIDEIHTLVGAVAGSRMFEVASILKPMLVRGELQIIGVSTVDEYRTYVEKDPALNRRFQPILVVEPTLEHAIEILKGKRDRYEAYHWVTITDAALVVAATLARRYVSDRPLPDSALELLDEAGAKLRIRHAAPPPDLRELDEKIAGVRREKESAIDAQDFERSAKLRDQEKTLLGRKAERQKAWKDGGLDDTVAELDDDLIIEIVANRIAVPVEEIHAALSITTPNQKTPRLANGVEPTYLLLNDQPVESAADDLLDAAGTAAGIASILSRAASPFVLAIDGSWGVGKSTLLRQIDIALPGPPHMVKVRFNAWTAQGENALEALIKSVISELDLNVIRRWIRRLGKRQRALGLARLGFALVARFFGVARLIDELWTRLEVNAQSRNEFRTVIHDMLADWAHNSEKTGQERTLVVFIDDLDRCSDEVVIKVCEAVKLYLDAPGLIFLLGCDLSVLARGVSANARGGESAGRTYLEKIIQVVHRVPTPDQANIVSLIQSYARRAGIAKLMDDAVAEILAERTGRNPRRIKRIINSFVLEHHLNPAWRNPPLGSTQLIIVIILQHLYPEFYERLASERSGKDPIGEFLDYVTVRTRVTDPPGGTDTWWSTASRVFRRYGLAPPGRTAESQPELLQSVEQIERLLPAHFPELALNDAFVALLREVGDARTRVALRSQLINRPLGTGTFPIGPPETPTRSAAG